MAFNIRYTLRDPNGIYVNWYHRLLQFTVQGKEVLLTGAVGNDDLFVQAGASADATNLGLGSDGVYFSDTLDNYTQTINQETGVYTFTHNSRVGEVVKVLVSDQDDVLYFKGGILLLMPELIHDCTMLI